MEHPIGSREPLTDLAIDQDPGSLLDKHQVLDQRSEKGGIAISLEFRIKPLVVKYIKRRFEVEKDYSRTYFRN